METIHTLLFALQYTYIFSIYISSVYLYTRYILYVCINIYIYLLVSSTQVAGMTFGGFIFCYHLYSLSITVVKFILPST